MTALGSAERNPRSARIRRLIGIVVAGLSAAYFLAYLLDHSSDLAALEMRDGAAISLIGTVVFFTVVPLACAGLAWWLLLTALKVKLGFASALWILAITQIAKYLPGNIAHHIGRIELAADFGVRRGDAAWSLIFEAILVIGAGILAAMLGVGMVGPTLLEAAGFSVNLLQVGFLLLVVVTACLLLLWVINVWKPPALRRFLGAWQLARPPITVILLCVALYLLNGFATAAVLTGLQSELTGGDSITIWTMFSAWTVAWLLGFVTPGAPAGLGVREALFIAMLSPFSGPGGVLALAILQRLATTIAEGLLFGIAFFLRERFDLQGRQSHEGKAADQ